MNRWRKRIAAVLTAVLLISLVPISAFSVEMATVPQDEQEESPSPASLLPLREYKATTVNLEGYFQDELKTFPADEFIQKVNENCTYQIDEDASTIIWTKSDDEYYSSFDNPDENSFNGVYAKLEPGGTIDLSVEDAYSSQVYIQLIVGDGLQTTAGNVRIIVPVKISRTDDLFDFEVRKDDGNRTELPVYDYYYNATSPTHYCQIELKNSENRLEAGDKTYLGVYFKNPDKWSEVSVKAYEGCYDTLEEFKAAAEQEIAGFWQDDIAESGGLLRDYTDPDNMPEVTLAFTRNGNVVAVVPMSIYMYVSSPYLEVDIKQKDDPDGHSLSPYQSRSQSYVEGIENLTFTLRAGNKANAQYRVSCSYTDYSSEEYENDPLGVNEIKAAYEGVYDTEQAASGKQDIKDQLFSTGGYLTDGLDGGKSFTIFFNDGHSEKFRIIVVEGSGEPRAPDPLSEDTYFRINGAELGTLAESEGEAKAYVMPYTDDSYYFNGFQTVFITDGNGEPVEDGTIIRPTFVPIPNVKNYAREFEKGFSQMESADLQESGANEFEFENGKVILYSAGSESGRRLKNYWVTFLTPQEEAKLFVNGINGGNKPDNGEYIREVFLTQEFGYHHDVFLANIGKQDLTGVTVTLDDAQNVKLDSYWSLENSTISGFNSVDDTTQVGQLSNFTKVRLVPDGEGEIKGTLVIKAGSDTVRIKLSGTAQLPKILTTDIIPGVLYVPYYSLIQTTNMYGGSSSNSVNVEFTAEGSLPPGVELKPNGELYGVPTQTGSFNFTAIASVDGNEVDRKDFTLVIDPNEDAPVWTYDETYGGDENYKIEIAIPDEDNTTVHDGGLNTNTDGLAWSNETRIFKSMGQYGYFVDLWLDGEKLVRGTDYEAESGSTVMTIRTQTLTHRGNGVHTLAAEFREGSSTIGTVRRAAENYYLNSIGVNPTPPNNSGGSGGSGGSGSSSRQYNVNSPSQTSGGSVSTDLQKAKRGERVTVTVDPEAGYYLESLQVYDKDGNPLELTKVGENQYSFVMPAGDVVIEPVFAQMEIDPATGLPFFDVRSDDWFYPYVKKAYDLGLMVGTSENTFSPDATSLRGMFVTVLYQIAGRPAPAGTVSFTDVTPDLYYANAVAWAAENGFIAGYEDGRFGGDDPVTREQIVAILMLYAKSLGYDVSASADVLASYQDAGDISGYAMDAMRWGVSVGLIGGKGDGILDPAGIATRKELATLFTNFCDLIGYGVDQTNGGTVANP